MSVRCLFSAAAMAFFLSQAAVSIAAEPGSTAGDARPRKVLIIAGPCSHPPGTHEALAGARLLKHCLENTTNADPFRVDLRQQWPASAGDLAGLACVVFIGDIFPPEQMSDPAAIKASLAKLMGQGCGIVCLHYATGLRKQHVGENGEHPLLQWLGGYFATGCEHHRSTARVCPATLEPTDTGHAVLRGWKAFPLDDEPYWNNYFGPDGPAENVTPLATAMLPPEAPQREIVAWAVERPDGGRGVGIVFPHYFRNWKVDPLRTLVINGIFWSAGAAIPQAGVQTPLPDLANFAPGSVEPRPRRKR